MDVSRVVALSAERPFPGLRPFSFADSAYFCGRDSHIYALYRLLDVSRFVAVIGSSGSGKSSLVRAGLFPLLQEESKGSGGRSWLPVEMRPGDAPVDRLAKALCGLARQVAGSNDEAIAATRDERIVFALKGSSHGVADALAEIDGLAGSSIVLLVDQFEEIFRFSRDAAHKPDGGLAAARARDETTYFVQLLLDAARTRDFDIHVLITMRSDFIGDCARFVGLPEAVSATQFLVPALSRDQREEVITGPIARARAEVEVEAEIEKGLVQQLLNDAPDELDQLPVLQHCLLRLWECAGPPHHLTLEHYRRIGGMSGALSRHAEEVLGELSGLEPAVKRTFQALAEVDKEGRIVRRSRHFDELLAETELPDDVLRRILDRFRNDDCSFLVPLKSELPALANRTRLDVGHEALLRHWEKISGAPGATGEANDKRPIGWLKEEENDGRRYAALLSIARDDRAGRTILPPEQIEWWERRRPTPAWAERYGGGYELVAGLIQNSRAAIAAEQEREALERVARRRTRVLRFAVPVLLLLLVGVITGYYFTNQQRQIANDNSKRALTTAAALLDSVLASLNRGAITAPATRALLAPVEEGYLANPGKASPTAEIAALKVRLLVVVSDTQMTLGDTDQALRRAKQAADIAKRLVAEDGKNPRWQHLRYSALFRVGDLVLKSGLTPDNLRQGIRSYEQAQGIAKLLVEREPGNGTRQHDLAVIDNKIGDTLRLRNKSTAAVEQFEAALRAAKVAAAQPGATLEWSAYVPITLIRIGGALARHDKDAAMERYSEALTLQKQLAAQAPKNASLLSNVAKSHRLIGDLLLKRGKPGDFKHAVEQYEAAIKINKELVQKDPGNVLWLGYLAAKYLSLGQALAGHGDTKAALVPYREELALRDQLVKRAKNAADRRSRQRKLDRCKERIAALEQKLASTPTGSIGKSSTDAAKGSEPKSAPVSPKAARSTTAQEPPRNDTPAAPGQQAQ